METVQTTPGDEFQPVARSETEEAVRLILGSTHNGQRFREHQLVRAMCVQVHAGQKCSLTGVSLKEGRIN